MALARVHTWIAGEVLTASDLNAEFNNILNNSTALISPLTANLAFGGFSLTGLGAGSASTPSLSFTSDANTGLFSSSADHIALSAGGSQVLTASPFAVTAATSFVATSLLSNPPAQHALYTQNTPKAWVNFIGRDTNGAATISSAFNVSSVTRIAAGQYTITYQRSFAAASNYAVLGSAFLFGNSAIVMGHVNVPTPTDATVIFFNSTNNVGADPHECMVTVMGNQ